MKFTENIQLDRILNVKIIHVILSSVEKKLRFLMNTFQDFSPYNGLQWEPNGSRSKRQLGE